jgi:hypothetical protein
MRRLVDVRYAGQLVAQLPGCGLRRNRRPVVFLMREPGGDAAKILALQSYCDVFQGGSPTIIDMPSI